MDSEHRKIELQSPVDLAYLTTRLRTLALSKLNLHLPPVSDTNSPDELRAQVEAQVNAFVAQVLQGMRQNISINGIDVVTARDNDAIMAEDGMEQSGEVETVEYELFDDKLRSKLAAMVARRDALVSKISSQRRTVPRSAAEAWQEQFARESEALFAAQEKMEDSASVLGEEGVADVKGIERDADVRRNWERAVEGLARLNKELPETRARLERCGDVVGFLGGGGK
jgi:kinetochor protein Mis14/NSL1